MVNIVISALSRRLVQLVERMFFIGNVGMAVRSFFIIPPMDFFLKMDRRFYNSFRDNTAAAS